MSHRADRYHRELVRCDREIAEMRDQPVGQPAYLTTLGILDWEREKKLILQERMEVQRMTANSDSLARTPSGPRAGDGRR